MIQLIYGSTAVKPFTSPELVELLNKARQKNERLNITGLLLYFDSSFIQVLEGDAAAVDGLMESIKADERHEGIAIFFREEVTNREFPDWEMAFLQISDDDIAKLPGYSEVLKQRTLNSRLFADNPSKAKTFLNAFMQNLR